MGPLGRPKSSKNNKQAKPTKKQRGRLQKHHNSQSTEAIEDVGPEVALLLAEQNSDGGEEPAETERNQAEATTKSPSGIPIPTSKLKSWPSWRSHFFSNWREDKKELIYAQCKLCNDGRFFLARNKHSPTLIPIMQEFILTSGTNLQHQEQQTTRIQLNPSSFPLLYMFLENASSTMGSLELLLKATFY